MIVKNPPLLKSCRTPGPCAYCKKRCKRREPAHIISRGAGGSDLSCNLVALGSSIEPMSVSCRCHSMSHAGQKPDRFDLLKIVAERENCTTDDVLIVIRFVQQLDKYASSYKIIEGLCKLPEAARRIARRELEDAGKLEAEAA